MTFEYDNSRYEGATIRNIRRGRLPRSQHIIYADLVSATGEILISATLEYIHKTLMDRLPKEGANMTKLQPTEAWAAVGPDGKIGPTFLRELKITATLEADYQTRRTKKKYTVQRVIITAKESE